MLDTLITVGSFVVTISLFIIGLIKGYNKVIKELEKSITSLRNEMGERDSDHDQRLAVFDERFKNGINTFSDIKQVQQDHETRLRELERGQSGKR